MAKLVPKYRFDIYERAEQFAHSDASKGLLWIGLQRHPNQTRHYDFWEVETFLQWYVALHPCERFCHEYGNPSRAYRLIIDAEHKNWRMADKPWPSWEQMLEALIETVVRVASSKLKIPTRVDPRKDIEIWNAHRDNIRSTHIYVDLWFRIPSDVLAFMNEVLNESPRLTPFIDMKVYPYRNFQSMRMPYSDKLKVVGQRTLVCALLRSTSVGNFIQEEVDVAALRRSIVSIPPPNVMVFHTMSESHLPFPEPALVMVRFLGQDVHDERVSARLDEAIVKISDWLKDVKGAKRVRVRNGRHPRPNTISLRVHTVYCPVARRHHVSNGAYLRITHDSDGMITDGTFYCLDCEYAWRPEISIRATCHPELAIANDNSDLDIACVEDTGYTFDTEDN